MFHSYYVSLPEGIPIATTPTAPRSSRLLGVRAGTLVPSSHGTDSKVRPTSGATVRSVEDVGADRLTERFIYSLFPQDTGFNTKFLAEIIIDHL